MKNGKTVVLFILAFVVIGFIFIGEINFQSIATDSGFDTSYGGGSSGGSSGGGGYSGGGSSGGHSSSSSSINNPLAAIPIIILWELCFDSLFYQVLIGQYYSNRKVKNAEKKAKRMMTMRISVLIVSNVLLGLCNYEWIMIPFIIDFFGIFLLSFFFSLSFSSKRNLYSAMSDDKIKAILPHLDKEEFHFSAYQIYYEVQQAWMNFDYDRLRTLVTDELFNTYQTQLQTLELKNEKNVMNGFELKNVFIVDITVENAIEVIRTQLTVSFFDYIEKENGVVVRGNKDKKVEMTYLLTFVRSHTNIESCPHCGAKLESGETICTYCHSHIQSVGNDMKLSKKEVLRQR